MSLIDWKEALNDLLPTDESSQKAATNADNPTSGESGIQKNPLVIRFEKRNGKPATLISRFEGNSEKLAQLAAQLKKHCSVGGSTKDDEILIQGDVREKVAVFLEKKGYKVKGDLKKK